MTLSYFSFKIKQLQGTVSTRTLVTQDHNNGKFFSDIKLPCFFHSQNVAFLGCVVFKHCENSHLQTFCNPVKPTGMCMAAPHKYKLPSCSIESSIFGRVGARRKVKRHCDNSHKVQWELSSRPFIVWQKTPM